MFAIQWIYIFLPAILCPENEMRIKLSKQGFLFSE